MYTKYECSANISNFFQRYNTIKRYYINYILYDYIIYMQ